MDDVVTAVDDLVTRIQNEANSCEPSKLKAAFSSFLRGADPDALPEEWRNGCDVLGEAYMRLLSPRDRRAGGQVFTPRWAAEVMVGWAVRSDSQVLLDPGCGSGVILQVAACKGGGSSLALHGLDIDPVALEMTRLNCAMRNTEVDVEQVDFLLDEISLRPDCVVANPPYTRHHELDPGTKDAIHQGLGKRLNLRYTRQASLHALFLARAVEIAADHARLAFITPSQWLSTKYGLEVRAYVESVACIHAVLELPYDFFPNARTSASITFIVKGEGSVPPKARSLGRELPPVDDVLTWLNQPYEPSTAIVEDTEGMVPLSNLAKVSRGFATGHNAFFVLSEAERLRRDIPVQSLRRCITSPRIHRTDTLTDADFDEMTESSPRWLLYVERDDPNPMVRDYVEFGEELGVDERYLARQRNTWYELKCRDRYPILFSYLNKNRPHVVLNETSAVPLNTWLVIEPNGDVDPKQLAHALASDRVAESARSKSRHYGHGLWKLEPSELRQLLVPWPGDRRKDH